MTDHHLEKPARRRRLQAALTLSLAAGLGGLAAAPSSQPLGLRLVGLMHENLAVVNRIDEALARDDFGRIRQEAAHLKTSAAELKGFDLAQLGLDPGRDARFDEYLSAQQGAANAIAAAARREDAPAVLREVEHLFRDACLRCHTDFRESQALHKPPVLFMRNLLASVKSMNRGIVMNDFALVAREARQMGAVADIFTWTQVMESMFEIASPEERIVFRGHLDRLSAEAIRIESAAVERNALEVTQALRRMLQEGCLSCHARFRKKE
jgi:cytochrome c556